MDIFLFYYNIILRNFKNLYTYNFLFIVFKK